MRRVSWTDDPGFSLDYHIRRVRAPHPGDLRTVLDFVRTWSTSCVLDPARPLWECTVVDGSRGWAGCVRAEVPSHHDRRRRWRGSRRQRVRLRSPTVVRTAGGRDRGSRGGSPKRFVRASDPAGRLAAVDAPRRCVDRSTLRRSVLASGGRSRGCWLPSRNRCRPCSTGRSLDRRFDVLEVPLAEHASSRPGWRSGTINDVFLAGFGGGFHDFHACSATRCPALRVTMPISLRSEGDPPGGNRFTPARFVLPIDDPDPVARARIAGDMLDAGEPSRPSASPRARFCSRSTSGVRCHAAASDRC